jgi:DNA-binding YbaB/EbfC family protein
MKETEFMGGFDPKQLQEMVSVARRQYEDLMRKMQETVVESSSGGGSVTVRMNGQKHVLRVVIDPEAVKSGDIEMLQDLVTAAVNGAVQKVDEAMKIGDLLGRLPGIGSL